MGVGVLQSLALALPYSAIARAHEPFVSDNHLDVGVGTGYFVDRCRFPSEATTTRIARLNQNCLRYAAQRVAGYQPTTHQASILAPIAWDAAPFASISLNYVLHCLPGNMAQKTIALDHLLPMLSPGGVLFGSTLLGRDVKLNPPARWLLSHYNRRGIFSNATDDAAGLRTALEQRFTDVAIEVIGCAALFSARKR